MMCKGKGKECNLSVTPKCNLGIYVKVSGSVYGESSGKGLTVTTL